MSEYVNKKRINDPSPDGNNYKIKGYQAVFGEDEKLINKETAFATRLLENLIVESGAKDKGDFIAIKTGTHISKIDNGKVVEREDDKEEPSRD